MTWSFSRISCFHACPYKFYITYLSVEPVVKLPMFYSDFGSFMHELLAWHYRGLKRDWLINEYLTWFNRRVLGRPPSQDIFTRYFQQGLACIQSLKPSEQHIHSVEERHNFHVGEHRFVGIADLTLKDADGKITICDHKSHDLKPRSNRAKPTRSDQELDEYLRQLYLYAASWQQHKGTYPTWLVFNCYRTGTIIREPFNQQACDEALSWAQASIRTIQAQTSWPPNLDYYYCKHICDVHHECEYYALEFQKGGQAHA